MFQELLEQYGIADKPTTVRNPQSNAICERMHQTVANTLRTLLHIHPPRTQLQAEQLINNSLATTMHATRCSVSRTLQNSPGSLVFQRDMFIDVPLIADLEAIRHKRQLLVDDNVRRMNLKRREHRYAIGDLVYVRKHDANKLDPRMIGPYPITQVYTNGTVDIARNPFVNERINIRHLIPKK